MTPFPDSNFVTLDSYDIVDIQRCTLMLQYFN